MVAAMSERFRTWLKTGMRVRIPGLSRAQKRPDPAWWKPARKAFKILLLLLLVGFTLWRFLLYREVSARLDAIHAGGFPLSGAALNHWRPAVPDADNAMLTLTQE